MRNTALTSTYTNEFDRDGTLTAQSLSKAHRKPLRGVACGVLVAIGIALCIEPYAGSSEQMQFKSYISYKQYASMLLDNSKEYKCLDQLYTHESNWRPSAKNGTHYGIPQGNSDYLSRVDVYKQIKWGLTYINSSNGTPCISLHN